MGNILIVDDESDGRLLLTRLLSRFGHETVEAESGELALELLRSQEFDLVLLDFRMPGMSGIEALKEIKRTWPQLPVILVTAVDEAETAMEAMSLGAYDYLTKPPERDLLAKVIGEALNAVRLMQVQVDLGTDAPGIPPRERIVGRSPAMWELYKQIGQVAPTEATVLITGESGTGKELVARAVFKHGGRADREFQSVNCAAIPESLLESELFGHEKGAFTSADHRHVGIFERASGGTLFLDEIGELSPQTQVKLLRVLQERNFERVGGEETIECDVRIIAATNQDIEEEVEEGRFREDLYYRLNVVHLHIPPLRERKEDIPELCSYLLDQVAREVTKPLPLLSAEVLDLLMGHDWPGNVRELRNVLSRASLASPTQVILPEHLSFPSRESGPPVSPDHWPFTREHMDRVEEGLYGEVLREVEQRLFNYALQRTGGNQVHACKLLGVSRNMLRSRMRDFGLLGDEDDS